MPNCGFTNVSYRDHNTPQKIDITKAEISISTLCLQFSTGSPFRLYLSVYQFLTPGVPCCAEWFFYSIWNVLWVIMLPSSNHHNTKASFDKAVPTRCNCNQSWGLAWHQREKYGALLSPFFDWKLVFLERINLLLRSRQGVMTLLCIFWNSNDISLSFWVIHTGYFFSYFMVNWRDGKWSGSGGVAATITGQNTIASFFTRRW